MKDMIYYIKPVHIFLLALPIFFVIGIFLFKADIETRILNYADKLFFESIKHKKYNVSFVLNEYNPVQIEENLIANLISPVYKKEIPKKSHVVDLQDLKKIKPSFIYIGKDKYVIINKVLYKEGDYVLGKYKIVRIEDGKIKISWDFGEKWLYIYQ